MERVRLTRERVRLIEEPEVPLVLDIAVVPVEQPPPDPRNTKYHIPTPYTRRQVELMVAYGIPHDAMAHIIGVGSKTTLEKHYADEIKHGASRANALAAHRLFGMMMQTEDMRTALSANIFWLKTRGGWRESTNVIHSGNIQHEHEHRAISHEERAIRALQIFASAGSGGAGSAVIQRLRALVAPAGSADDGVPQPGG